MKAMILAAGRGERLRPITDTCPKPLIEVGGRPLILWHIEKLKAVGITDIVVNSAHLSDLIVSCLGDGSQFGVHITHSIEPPGGLETAGGIIKALPHLGKPQFLVVNGDTFIDGDYGQFLISMPNHLSAVLFLTENPPHNLKGDFSLQKDGNVVIGPGFTFTGAGVYKTQAFAGLKVERRALKPFYESWASKKLLQGKILNGTWFDVGTIERLQHIRAYLGEKQWDFGKGE